MRILSLIPQDRDCEAISFRGPTLLSCAAQMLEYWASVHGENELADEWLTIDLIAAIHDCAKTPDEDVVSNQHEMSGDGFVLTFGDVV